MKFAICIFVIVGAVFGIYFKIAMDNAQRKDNCRQLLEVYRWQLKEDLKKGMGKSKKNEVAKSDKPEKKNSKKPPKKPAPKLPLVKMDSDTASKLLSKAMGLPKDQWDGPLVPQHFSVDFRNDNNVKVVVRTKAFGFFPVACSANVKIESGGYNGEKFTYKMSSPKIGILPLLAYSEVSLDLIKKLSSSCQAIQNAKNASEISTSDGSLTVKF